MTLLSVNLNKIAVLRNSRGGGEPSVLAAAHAAIEAGVQLGAGLPGVVVEDDPQRLLDAAEQAAQLDIRRAAGRHIGQQLISSRVVHGKRGAVDGGNSTTGDQCTVDKTLFGGLVLPVVKLEHH